MPTYSLTLRGDLNRKLSYVELDNNFRYLEEAGGGGGATPNPYFRIFGETGALDLSIYSYMKSLVFAGEGNDITSLSVTGLTLLRYIRCGRVELTSLDISTNTALTNLGCKNNQLTSLDISANTALTYLECDGNQLTSLDISTNTALTYLSCNGNQLTVASVNEILIDLDTHGLPDGYLDLSDLSGGTNAAPTGAGATAVSNLTDKGWSVMVAY